MSSKPLLPKNNNVNNHNYAARMQTSSESVKRKEAFSPAKSAPVSKKQGMDNEEGMSAVLEALKVLTDKVDTIGTQLQQNTVMVASITKAVEFNVAEIKDCKAHLQITDKEMATLKKDNAELLERVLELERYKRRWNLRIRGMKEEEGEATRDKVVSLLFKIFPTWSLNVNHIVDSTHRIGRLEANKTRQIIIQFTQRLHRDALWKTTKNCSICKEMGISFVEDLCKADKESRALHWPEIQAARAAGKRAYYRGGTGFIEGKIIA